MTSEEIKREIAELEPLEKAAWAAYRQAEDALKPLNDAWSKPYNRLAYLRTKLEVVEETERERAAAAA